MTDSIKLSSPVEEGVASHGLPEGLGLGVGDPHLEPGPGLPYISIFSYVPDSDISSQNSIQLKVKFHNLASTLPDRPTPGDVRS